MYDPVELYTGTVNRSKLYLDLQVLKDRTEHLWHIREECLLEHAHRCSIKDIGRPVVHVDMTDPFRFTI